MKVIGTAGHVDHGKSTLVEALTGIDPDRLKEEKDRQMTIDLGFAWMTLPSGEGLGIVDVPGHRDFIENMLAGVGAINAAILVIAADEGLMPQTREHLAILDLLAIPELVVALTKVDLVDSDERIEQVSTEVHQVLESTQFAAAEVIPVSAPKGIGLEHLVAAIERSLSEARPVPNYGRPRLPVDRAFSISGFGTVVTGTLLDGEFRAGDAVRVLPSGLPARIRGLQTHQETVEVAVPASRVAINLNGVSVDDLARGDVIVGPGSDHPTGALDARVKLLDDSAVPLEDGMQVKLFTGAAQRMAKVRLLEGEKLDRGASGWVRLLMSEPLAVRRRDRMILRRPSPPATLGGGQVADPHPPGGLRRNDQRRIADLNALLDGSDKQVLRRAVGLQGGQTLVAAADLAGLALSAAVELIHDSGGELVVLNPDQPPGDWWIVDQESLDELSRQAQRVLNAYHNGFPKRAGMPRQELRSRLRRPARGAIEALVERGQIQAHDGGLVSLPGFKPLISQQEQQRMSQLLDQFASSSGSPPSVQDCIAAVGEESLGYLLETGKLIRVSESVVFEAGQYRRLVDQIVGMLGRTGQARVAEIRTELETTRKYALALLEHMDSIGVTYRDGDFRRLVRPA